MQILNAIHQPKCQNSPRNIELAFHSLLVGGVYAVALGRVCWVRGIFLKADKFNRRQPVPSRMTSYTQTRIEHLQLRLIVLSPG